MPGFWPVAFSVLAVTQAALEAERRPDPQNLHLRRFETSSVTPLGLDVRGDGPIILSVVGTLQELPAEGGEGRQLVVGSDFSISPKVSPDGAELIYLSNARPAAAPSDEFSIWLARRDGSSPRQVANQTLRSFAWDDRSHGVFGVRPDYRGQLFKLDLDRGLLTGFEFDAQGGVACCVGSQLLFANGPVLGLVGKDGTGARDLFRLAEGHAIWNPVLAPDRRSVAFIELAGSTAELKVFNLQTQAAVVVDSWPNLPTSSGPADYSAEQGWFPAFDFSADGRSVIHGRDGTLIRSRLDGSKDVLATTFSVSRLARPPVMTPRHSIPDVLTLRQLRWPTWSRDGADLIVSAAGHLWRRHADGAAARVTAADGLEYFPTRSPDGTALAYVEVRSDGRSGLRLLDLVTGENRLLLVGDVIARPTFSPDGTSLAYFRYAGATLEAPVYRPARSLELRTLSLASGHERTIRVMDWPAGRANMQQYYPSLTWAADGDLFMLEEADQYRYALLAINPLTRAASVRLQAEGALEFMSVSPSGRRAARYGRRRLEIIDLETQAVLATFAGKSAQYLEWAGDDEVRFTSGNIERAWRVGGADLETEREVIIQRDRARSRDSYAFTGVTVLSMGPAGDLEDATVVVRDGRIVEVGPSSVVVVPETATVIPAQGKFLMPGLIDAHTHLHYPVLAEPELLPRDYWRYRGALAFGVTTVFDPAATTPFAFASAELVEAGETLGPRIFSTGYAINRGTDDEDPAIRSPEDALEVVRGLKEAGALMLKSYVLDRDQRRWLVAAGEQEGVAVTVEGGDSADAVLNFYEDGIASFEHDSRADGRSDFQAYIASTGVVVTPTLVVESPERARRSPLAARLAEDPRVAAFYPPSVAASFRNGIAEASTSLAPMSRKAEDSAELDAAGVLIAVGAHGLPSDTQLEMQLLCSGGMPNARVLRAATLNGARKLGLDHELGSIEVGKLADLLLLRRDPRLDLSATADIALVVARGQPYDPMTLQPTTTVAAGDASSTPTGQSASSAPICSH